MLDVITDFWKPVKKAGSQEKLDLGRLQVGSIVTFGTVPQALVSGRRFEVTGINTYQFGDERMTSFVLSQNKDDSVSLIVANAEGEQYLAISRRIGFTDRMRMFDTAELEAVVEQPEAARLVCKEIDASWKHWVVTNYKKEISGLRGSVTRGEGKQGAGLTSQPFDYLLLTSDNNEYAIEVERYADGRLELYATIYRRVSDISELEHPQSGETRAPGAPVLEVVKPEPTEAPATDTKEKKKAQPEAAPAKAAVQETAAEAVSSAKAPLVESNDRAVPLSATPVSSQPAMETSSMQSAQAINGAVSEGEQANRPKPGAAPESSHKRQEIKAVTQRNHAENENDAIECDLRVANKIIEEAIRNEMRLSDIIRRIIALPVANPESVQIPVTLTDSDFQLLAIRYGVPAAERAAIKSRIIDEINGFSGNGKKAPL